MFFQKVHVFKNPVFLYYKYKLVLNVREAVMATQQDVSYRKLLDFYFNRKMNYSKNTSGFKNILFKNFNSKFY